MGVPLVIALQGNGL